MKRVSKPSVYTGIALLLVTSIGSTARSDEQYKKLGRDAVSQMVDGKFDKAIQTCADYLQEHPDDVECMYLLAVAYANKKDYDKAKAYAEQAIENGLPRSRFHGPSQLWGPSVLSGPALERLMPLEGSLLHGPMVGSVTDTSAKFWVRAYSPSVRIEVRPAESEQASRVSVQASVAQSDDWTAVLEVDGLRPHTQYEYSVALGSASGFHAAKPEPSGGRFRTFPKEGTPSRVTIGFGGGAGYTPKHEGIWDVIRSRQPQAFLFLGDNVYIDDPEKPAVQKYCYYRRQSRPEFRRFTASTPIYAIWDDHDFTINDGWGGPAIDEPAWKIPVWRLFRQNWVNPYYGGGDEQPGCWFHFSIGDVDFIMLDGRFYREKGKRQGLATQNVSMLGAAQKKWLFERLRASKGTFKVLASPVPWTPNTKPGSAGMDTWDGFAEEREEILSFLERNKIDGVVLLAADRHRSDVWKTPRPAGYDLYEFESSRLSNVHTHKEMPGALFSYNDKCSFGLLTFDTTPNDPYITYKIVNIDNEVVHTFTVTRSQLTHK